VSDIDPATVPGYPEAVAAVLAAQAAERLPTSSHFPAEEVAEVVQLVMVVTRPYVQAEMFADAADYLHELGLIELAEIWDNVSAGMRKALGNG